MQLSQVLAKPSGAFILDSENRKVLAVLGANSEIHKRILIVAAAARDLGAEVAEMNETQWLNQIPNLGARLQAIIGPFNAWRISTGFKLTPEPWQRMGPMLRDAQGKLIGMIESMAQPVSVFHVLELAPTLVYELDQIVRELADDEALTSERSDELKSRLQSLSRHS